MNLFPCSFALLPLFASAVGAAVVAEYTFDDPGTLSDWSSSLNINSLAIAGGEITGTASSNDPQLRTTGFSYSPTVGATWNQVQFRVREVQDEAPGGEVNFNAVGIVVSFNNNTNFTSGFSATPVGGGFYDVSIDVSSFGTTPITALRVDPIGGAAANSNSQTSGNMFQVSSIVITDNAVVPEPSSLLMLGLAGLGFLRRRR